VLNSVSCSSSSSCVAVGFISLTWIPEVLTQAWDGNSWSIVSNPTSDATGQQLRSASCVSVSWCVAVGYMTVDFVSKTLVLSLTGPEPAPTTTTSASPKPVAPAFTG
jgi:hypothetical protein